MATKIDKMVRHGMFYSFHRMFRITTWNMFYIALLQALKKFYHFQRDSDIQLANILGVFFKDRIHAIRDVFSTHVYNAVYFLFQQLWH